MSIITTFVALAPQPHHRHVPRRLGATEPEDRERERQDHVIVSALACVQGRVARVGVPHAEVLEFPHQHGGIGQAGSDALFPRRGTEPEACSQAPPSAQTNPARDAWPLA